MINSIYCTSVGFCKFLCRMQDLRLESVPIQLVNSKEDTIRIFIFRTRVATRSFFATPCFAKPEYMRKIACLHIACVFVTVGLGTCVDFPTSQSSIAITRLTTHLNQVTQEKNDILAQFFSQQSLIKQQQTELKGLLRYQSENATLHTQISALNKTVTVSYLPASICLYTCGVV